MLSAQQLLSQYEEYLLKQGLSPVSIERKLSSVRAYLTFIQPKKRDIFDSRPTVVNYEERLRALGIKVKGARSIWSQLLLVRLIKKALRVLKTFPSRGYALSYALKYRRPAWLIRYQKHPASRYLNLGLVVLFCVALGIGGYEQFNQLIAKKRGRVLGIPTNVPSYLSFQGLLTDSSGNPITTETHFRFSLYNNLTASGSAKLYEEAKWIKPDQDGIFNTLIGDTIGLDKTIFRDNTDLFLGVTVNENAEMTPRQRVATVAYAFNSQYLQGYGVGSSGANTNEIPVVDGSGNLIIAAASPSLRSSSGTFKIDAQTMYLTTASNGTINLDPGGTGNINLTSDTTTGNAINATASALTTGTLIYGGANNSNTGFKLLQLQAGSTLTDRFTVDASGNTIAAGNLSVGGTGTFGSLKVTGAFFDSSNSPGTNGLVLTSTGTGVSWANVSGSGGDANTLDGLDSTQFLRSDTSDSFTAGTLTLNVGTTADINGELTIADTDIAFDGASTNFTTSGNFSLNGSQFFLNQGNGNVGIGTTNPTQKLDVNGNLNVGGTGIFATLQLSGAFYDKNSQTGTSGQILSSSGSAVEWIDLPATGIGGSGTINYLPKFTASTTLGNSQIYDDNSGVGIGTTSPITGYLLDVNGNLRIGGTAYFADRVGIGTTSPSMAFQVGPYIGMKNDSGAVYGIGNGVTLLRDGTSTRGFSQDFAGTNTFGQYFWGSGIYISSVTSNPSGDAYNIPGGQLWVDGNVGIGTTNPSQKLDINGNLNVGGTGVFLSTKVGILLDKDSEPGVNQQILSSTGSGVDWVDITTIGVGGSGTINKLPKWLSSTTLTDSLIYDNGSVVGINTVSPTSGYILDVNGNFRVGGTAYFAQNVGIGTTNPTSKLVVAGDVAVNSGNIVVSSNYRYAFGDSTTRIVGSGNGASGYLKLAVNSNDSLYINSSGNVGIGTTNPSALAHFSSTAAQDLFRVDDNGPGDTSPFVIDSTGNVGIGTTSSGANLEVSGGASATNILLLRRADGGVNDNSWAFRMSSIYSGSNGSLLLFPNTSNADLNLGTNTTTVPLLTLKSGNGNIGIGTTNPTQKLDINGNLNVGGTGVFLSTKVGILLDKDNQPGDTNQILASTGSGVDWMNISSIGIGGSGTANYIPKFTASTILGDSLIYDSGTNIGIGTTGNKNKLDINGSLAVGAYAGVYSAPSNGMIISGNVGIGNTGSSYALDVTGTGKADIFLASSATDTQAYGFKTGYYPIYIQSGFDVHGSVLMGHNLYALDSTNGTYKWAVSHSTFGSRMIRMKYSAGIEFFADDAAATADTEFTPTERMRIANDGTISLAGDTNTYWSHPANDTFMWTTNGTDRVVINANGNVGIGLTNPSALTHLSSTAAQDLLRVDDNGAGDTTPFLIDQNGNVGIGTTAITSGYALDVNGNTKVGGTAYFASYVGIGTTNPSQKLDVNGNLNVGGTGVLTSTKVGILLDKDSQPGNNTQILSSTGSGVDWVDIATIGVGGSGTNNYVPKWTPDGNHLGNSLIYDNGTSLGIGTTSPTSGYLLDINGNLRVGGTAYFAQNVGIGITNPSYLFEVGTGGNGYEVYINDDLLIADSLSASRMLVTGTGGIALGDSAYTSATPPSRGMIIQGNVGIGTTSPSEKLDINGDVNIIGAGGTIGKTTLANGWLKIGSTLAMDDNELYFGVDSYLGTIGAYGLSIETNAITRIALDSSGNINFNSGDVYFENSSGNVGIGTTDPSQKLDVNGNLNVGGTGIFLSTKVGILLDTNSNSGAAGSILASTGTGVSWSSVSDLSVGNANTLDTLDSLDFLRSTASDTFEAGNTLTIAGDLIINDSDIGLGGTSANLTTTGNFSINGSQFLISQSSGNIGIGTTDVSSYKLNVNGNLNVGGTGIFGSLRLIGAFYDTNNQTGLSGHVLSSTGGGAVDWVDPDTLVTNYWQRVSTTLSPATYGDHITTSGNVGIGSTASPLNKLDVYGGVAIGTYAGTYTAASNNLIISGNIGIGITSPTQKLEVAGNVRLASGYDLYLDDIRIGATGSSNSTAGAYKIGTFDEFDYSNSQNVQGVLNDLDVKLGEVIGGTAGLWYDAGTVIYPTVAGPTSLGITDIGNVGIGTTAPTSGYVLDVAGNLRVGGTAYFASYVGIGTTNPTSTLEIVGSLHAHPLAGGTGLYYNPADNALGLGTTSPHAIDATSRLVIADEDGNNSDMAFRVASSSYGAIYYKSSAGTLALPTVSVDGDMLGNLVFEGYDGANFRQAASIRGEVDGGPGLSDMPGSLAFYTTADNSITHSQRMKINNQGNIVIGTGEPTAGYKLDVTGNLRVGGTGYFASRVGIGTTNPAASLHLLQSTGTELRLETSGVSDPTLSFKTTNSANQINMYLDESEAYDTLVIAGQTASSRTHVNITALDGQMATLYLSSGSNSSYIAKQTNDDLEISAATSGADMDFYLNVGGTIYNPIALDGATGDIIINEDSRDVDFRVEGDSDANLFYADGTNDRVGIGTGSPTAGYKLDVAGNLRVGGTAYFASYVGIATTNPQVPFQIGDVGAGNTGPFFQVASSANVGIGATAGQYKLYVNGDTYINGTTTVVQNLRLNGNQILNAEGTGTILLSSTPTTTWSTLDAGAWRVYNTANVGQAALAVIQDMGGDIFTASSSSQTRFVIKNDGNVGIGTTNPTTALEIWANNSGNSLMRFRNTSSDGYSGFDFNNESGTLTSSMVHSNSTASVLPNSTWLGTRNAESLHLVTNGTTPRLTIDSTGNVGIGTTNPQAKLDIGGATSTISNASGDITLNSASNNISLAGDSLINVNHAYFSGNVGIGTTNPTERLEVNGNIKVIDRLGIGINPLYDLDVSAANSRFWGSSTYHEIYLGGSTRDGAGLAFDGYDLYLKNYESAANGDIFFNVNVGATAAMTIAGSGNVGIGTNTPTQKLDVVGAIRNVPGTYGQISLSTPAGLNGIIITSNSTTGYRRDYRVDDTKMYWGISATTGIPTSQMSLNNSGAGIIAGGWTTGAPDLAEYYNKLPNEKVTRGDIVSTADNSSATKSTTPYSPNLLGIISTKPGLILGGGVNRPNFVSEDSPIERDDEVLVALSGRVPAKVSSLNGNIATGDLITSSSLPGFGMKATKVGPTVAKALESSSHWNETNCPTITSIEAISWPQDNELNAAKPCFRLPNGTYVGKLMVFVNIGWYDPDFYLTSTGEVSSVNANYDGLLTRESLESQGYLLVSASGETVERLANFAEVAVAKVKAGLVRTTNLIAENILVEGKLVAPLVETDELTADGAVLTRVSSDYISPLSGNDLVIDLYKNSQIATDSGVASDGFGKLIVKGDSEFTGNVGIGQTLEAKDASISGELYAESARIKKLRAESIEGLEAIFATMSANYIKGTESVYNNDNNISGLEEQVSTPAADLDLTDSSLATDSSELEAMASSWEITNPSDDVKIESNVSILGVTTLAQTIVSGPLTQDGTLLVDNGNSINVLGGTLYLQNQGGGLDLLAGKVTIDSLGNTVFEGNLTVKATLFAGLVKPLDGGDLTIDLSHSATNSAEPASVGFGRLLARGTNGETVFSLDASGSAQFTGEVAAASFKIARDAVAAEPDIYGTIEATASAGLAKIPAGSYEVTIKSPYLKEKSLIYLTPIGSTANQVIYLARTNPDYQTFTAAIDGALTKDILFSWWIVN
jgi:hypothetical protein